MSVNFVLQNLFDFSEWHLLWFQSLQGVSVDFVPPNLFNFAEQHLLWCLISTASECWFCATKSVWFSEQHLLWCLISTVCECWFHATKSVWLFWATSALVSNLYRQWVLILYQKFCWATSPLVSDLSREWVLILCHQICLNLLSTICFGVWPVQEVSIDFVPPNLFDFAEWHLLWCLVSTVCECWFYFLQNLSCWAMPALVSDLYRQWVLILCHQICLIFLSNICFGVWSLQAVSVDFLPPNLFDFPQQHLLWYPISTASEHWFTWATSTLVSDFYRQWVLILCHHLFDFSKQHLLWCLISTGSECWFCATKSVWFFWVISDLVSNLYRKWVDLCHLVDLFDFAEQHLLWCLISTVCECWFCATRSV